MTPQQKAFDLVERMRMQDLQFLMDHCKDADQMNQYCKGLALVAVDEILKTSALLEPGWPFVRPDTVEYWHQVKTEIQKL